MTLSQTSRLLAIALLTLSAGHTHASGKRLDQDQVREAVNAGEIRPLDEVTAIATNAVPGQVIKVEVERSHGVLVYELKIIGNHGRVREIKINAKTLDILEIE